MLLRETWNVGTKIQYNTLTNKCADSNICSFQLYFLTFRPCNFSPSPFLSPDFKCTLILFHTQLERTDVKSAWRLFVRKLF